MGYVIAAILVVLIVGTAIAFFVRSATARKGQAQIASPDEGTPLGDTDQHADEQTGAGETVGEGGVGGEAEGGRPLTQSERLADRPR